ncbi:hypothetical protein FBPa45_0117 [Pseudomonas phage vB_PaeS_FBPa45]|nr:hypothetical protein FBPa45_0117 [Pseudomonas phage vB_PaeS_FBPa45]WDS62491.1 hypothetical protein UFRH6_63 [Pseudomonas phage UF_RH6]
MVQNARLARTAAAMVGGKHDRGYLSTMATFKAGGHDICVLFSMAS